MIAVPVMTSGSQFSVPDACVSIRPGVLPAHVWSVTGGITAGAPGLTSVPGGPGAPGVPGVLVSSCDGGYLPRPGLICRTFLPFSSDGPLAPADPVIGTCEH